MNNISKFLYAFAIMYLISTFATEEVSANAPAIVSSLVIGAYWWDKRTKKKDGS